MRIAAKVAARKEAHPEQYCSAPRCLWALRSGPCPKHPYAAKHLGRIVVDDRDPDDTGLELPL